MLLEFSSPLFLGSGHHVLSSAMRVSEQPFLPVEGVGLWILTSESCILSGALIAGESTLSLSRRGMDVVPPGSLATMSSKAMKPSHRYVGEAERRQRGT